LAVKASSRPSLRHASRGLSDCDASAICSLKDASMPSKRLASSGSCSRMSSEPMKMASSEHHWRCTSIQFSSTWRTPARRVFHDVICASKKPMKRLPIMFCSATSWSSSASMVADASLRMVTPVFLKGSYSSCSASHVVSMRLSCLSILSSMRACSTVSPTCSAYLCSSSARSTPRDILSSMTNVLPQMRMSFFQWRSRIDSSRKSCTSGRSTSMSETIFIMPW